MAAVTRQLSITGPLDQTPAFAEIMVNGVPVFSGELGDIPGTPEPELAVVNYDGVDDVLETLSVSITITSGGARIGPIAVNQPSESPMAPWYIPGIDGPAIDTSSDNDGRLNILINGEPPVWPYPWIEPQPRGTPENPGWVGWCFALAEGDVFTCDYQAVEYILPGSPTFAAIEAANAAANNTTPPGP